MSELVAKPIVKNQYYIVTDGTKKVGNIEIDNFGYNLHLNGTLLKFSTQDELEQQTHIKFQTIDINNSQITIPKLTYPAPDKVYNSLYDIKRNLHLFTKTEKSKCLHVAGWFLLKRSVKSKKKTVAYCPKYLYILRHCYLGPFQTETEARSQINTWK